MTQPTGRRRTTFPFFFVALGCLVALAALATAKLAVTVRDRQSLLEAVEADGGLVAISWGSDRQPGLVRRLLGDKYLRAILLPATQQVKYQKQLRRLFPEAQVAVFTDDAFNEFSRDVRERRTPRSGE